MTELLSAFSYGKQIEKARARLSLLFSGRHTGTTVQIHFRAFLLPQLEKQMMWENEPKEAQYKPNEISSYPQGIRQRCLTQVSLKQ